MKRSTPNQRGPRAHGSYILRFKNVTTGQERVSSRYRNTMCVAGLSLLMAQLNLELPTTTPVYGAVGTGTATPTTSDVKLQTELARAVLASNIRSSNVVTWDFFFTTSAANPVSGNLTEAGIFLAASATADSGTMLSHVLINEPKTSAETLTVEFTMTLASGD